MAKFTKKITNQIDQQVPEFVLSDHPKFLEFVKTYYRFMESAEITLTNVELTDGIQLETETAQTNNLVLDGSRLDTDRTQLDAGDKIILEDSSFGKFERGETVTGSTSNATATVLSEDLVNNRLFISAQDKFVQDEVITGGTSGARAQISNYKPNPVTNIQELLNFRDPDKAISNFLTRFRNEFLNTLPENLDNNVDKRKLIKNIKSVYRAKGTQRGHEVFFRFLFNLDSETFYPREQMLRVSDGQFDTKKILRAIGTVGNTSDLIGRTITGQTSSATAIVENVFKFQIGADEVSEFILNEDSISGTFSASEEIRGTETDEADTFIKATVTGIPDVVSITNDGGLLNAEDSVTLTGGGASAIIQVDNIGSGDISEVLIDDAGSGYAIGDDLTFTNTNTNGGGATAKVSVVNGGIQVEGTTEDHIVLEDETVRGDVYTGNKVVQESGTGSGDITDIRIINGGSGYTKLPTATVSTSSGGSGASVIPYGAEVGRLLNTKKVETGAGYEASPSPTLTFPSYIILKDKSVGNFIAGETITGNDASSTSISATFVSFTSDNNILKVSGATGQFEEGSTLTGSSSGITASILKNDLATATITVGAVVDTAGVFLNEDGHLSETTMKIQDSLYYQDFSYVIKVGRSINDWRDSFKKTMHTAGFYFTGQVDIASQVNNQIRSFTGVNSGISFDPGADLVINTLFSTIFGRRLGTVDDGTTLRSNPELGVDPDFTDSTSEHFTSNTRDLTLNRAYTLSFRSGRGIIDIRGSTNNYGYAYCGPTMNSVNRFATGLFSGRSVVQEGTVGGQSTSFYTQEGDAEVRTTQYKFGGSSMFFDGTGDFLEVNAPGTGTMNGDFTVEMFYRSSAATTDIAALWDNGSFAGNGIAIYLNSNQFLITKNNGTIAQASAGLSNDTWHHIAYVRSSGTATIYVDGTSKVTGSIGTDDYSTYAYRIGTSTSADTGSINMGPAFIDEFRLSSVARYTSNFTAPTAAFETDPDTAHLFTFDDRYVTPMQMHNWANFRISGTYNTSLDGEVVQFRDITTNRLKTNLTYPTEIRLSY